MAAIRYDYRLPQFQWMNAEIAEFRDNNPEPSLQRWSEFLTELIHQFREKWGLYIVMDNTNHVIDGVDLMPDGQVDYTYDRVVPE